MRRSHVFVAGIVLSGAVATSPAWAAAPSDPAQVSACRNLISSDLAPATQGATFVNDKDRTALLGKLGSADQKLSQSKWADAYTYLAAYRDKAAVLQSAGKLTTDLASDGTAAITGTGACAWLAPATT